MQWGGRMFFDLFPNVRLRDKYGNIKKLEWKYVGDADEYRAAVPNEHTVEIVESDTSGDFHASIQTKDKDD